MEKAISYQFGTAGNATIDFEQRQKLRLFIKEVWLNLQSPEVGRSKAAWTEGSEKRPSATPGKRKPPICKKGPVLRDGCPSSMEQPWFFGGPFKPPGERGSAPRLRPRSGWSGLPRGGLRKCSVKSGRWRTPPVRRSRNTKLNGRHNPSPERLSSGGHPSGRAPLYSQIFSWEWVGSTRSMAESP